MVMKCPWQVRLSKSQCFQQTLKKWVSGSRVGPLKNNGNLSLVSENEGGEWVNEDSQSGFAGGRSCLVNSIEFFEEWIR